MSSASNIAVSINWSVGDPEKPPLQFLEEKIGAEEFRRLRKIVISTLAQWPEHSNNDASHSHLKDTLEEIKRYQNEAANENLRGMKRAEAMGYLPGLMCEAKAGLASLPNQMSATEDRMSGLSLQGCIEDYARTRDSLQEGEEGTNIVESISVTATASAIPEIKISIGTTDLWYRDENSRMTSVGGFVDGAISLAHPTCLFDDVDGTFPASMHVKDEMLSLSDQAASFFRNCPNGLGSGQGQPGLDFARAANLLDNFTEYLRLKIKPWDAQCPADTAKSPRGSLES